MGNLYLLIFENKYPEASSLIGISPFYSPPPNLSTNPDYPPQLRNQEWTVPQLLKPDKLPPWLVLLVVFADVAGGPHMSVRRPHMSSSPLSLHLSSPASIPTAPLPFSPACSPSRWTAGAARPSAVPPHLLHSRCHHLHCRRRPSSIHPLR